ncbi:MAG: 4'-phosphopantetheinyl transferase superfamily protein [Proteobacteria bacterium]|nr:4'-phosphopantetheinyl transferase superfamily protein [Pseudomonadota bacterium]
MSESSLIYPVIVAVSEYERNLKGRDKVQALSLLARSALEVSCRKSGIILGVLNKDQNGAPVPFDGNFWSITHKSEYAGGVVAKKATGLDIEKIKPVSKALIDKVAGPKEWALSDSCKEINFFRFWTAKEAVLKASGKGISGLSDCSIEKIIDDKSLIIKYNNQKWEVLHYFFDGHIVSIVKNGFDIEWTLL